MTSTIPTPTPDSTTNVMGPSGEPAKIQEFKLNHPKNYLAVPIATAVSGDVDALISEYAVDLPYRARRCAIETGLITADGAVTRLGEAVIVTATNVHESPQEALQDFQELHGSPKRFVDVFPDWQPLTERLAFQYNPTKHLVQFLREQGPLRLHELTWLLWKRDPKLAKAVFLHPSTINQYEIGPETPPTSDVVASPDNYKSESTFQFKAYLYHCGVLADRGDYTSRLDPETDTWTLEETNQNPTHD